MTHEQKPESAEFRTREAQLASHFGPHFLADFTEEGLRKELSEAEARGAAEQRRKDAEGVEPVGFTDQDDLDRVKKGKSGDIYSSPRPGGVDEDYWPIPLYTRPANVAALEDRVKELEGAINAACEHLSAPAWTICSSTHCERAIECRSPGECGGTGKPSALRILRAAAIREGGEHG